MENGTEDKILKHACLICLASLRIKLVRSLLLKILGFIAFVYITFFACVTSGCASENTTLNKKPKISKGRHHVTEALAAVITMWRFLQYLIKLRGL